MNGSIAKDFDVQTEPTLDKEKIAWKTSNNDDAKKYLEKVLELLGGEGDIMKYAEAEGKGNVLWPMRYALSGMEKSPDPLTLLKILGQEESEKRIRKAIEVLK